MQRDIRSTALYREAADIYELLRQPGTGQISDAAEIHVAGDDRHAVFSGTIMDRLEGAPSTRICQIDVVSGDTRVLTFGPNTDRSPRYSPDGKRIAFLSDRREVGDFQLYLLDMSSGAALPTPPVGGWVEYLHWSPDGKRILLGVAGYGADISGGQGAVSSRAIAEQTPSWMPTVQTGDESHRWRHVWVYELESDGVRIASPVGTNVWEATWCGNEAIAAVVSDGPGEGHWYGAHLCIVCVRTGAAQKIYAPNDQLGWPVGSPSGKHLAIVEAICSDRGIVAGDLLLIEIHSGKVRRADTHGVDVSFIEWRSDRRLLLAGHRQFETVVGILDAIEGEFAETWSSRDLTTGGFYVTLSGINETGDCVLVGENFVKGPEIATIRQGQYQPIRSLDSSHAGLTKTIESVDSVRWSAPDGLEIQGWLLRRQGEGPQPLVMNLHGGPVWHWRPFWLGRRGAYYLMLLKRGYAFFFPNPRGSSGRGRDFIKRIVGDMGGADTHDYLSGIDHLIELGIADPHRLGVTGVSYGGQMSSWLITQDARFAAAVCVSPVTNLVSEHLVSNIPHFIAMFLADTYRNPGGKYFERSPIMHAHKAKTPTLNICGALDRCTPPSEAIQFHNALLENRVESALVTYPEEGHVVKQYPAAIDYSARVVAWFEQHMQPASSGA